MLPSVEERRAFNRHLNETEARLKSGSLQAKEYINRKTNGWRSKRVEMGPIMDLWQSTGNCVLTWRKQITEVRKESGQKKEAHETRKERLTLANTIFTFLSPNQKPLPVMRRLPFLWLRKLAIKTTAAKSVSALSREPRLLLEDLPYRQTSYSSEILLIRAKLSKAQNWTERKSKGWEKYPHYTQWC